MDKIWRLGILAHSEWDGISPFVVATDITYLHGFLDNNGLNTIDLWGLRPAPRQPQDGQIYCNDKCEMVIKNCETWGAAAPCCQDHENVHITQLKNAGKWCYWGSRKEVVDGQEREVACCVGAGRVATYEDIASDPDANLDQVLIDAECPAYKASLDCCLKGMNTPGVSDEAYWDFRDCAFRSYQQRRVWRCPGYEQDPRLPPRKEP